MRAPADQRARPFAGIVVLGIYSAAGVVLLGTATSRIRYSADHDRTIGLWEVWIPVAAAILVARLVPPRLPRHEPEAADRPRREAWQCVAIAIAFALALPILGTPPPDGWYVALKLGLIAIVPSFVLTHRAWLTGFPQQHGYRHWWWTGPAAATAAWLGLAWLGPYARPSTSNATIVTLIAAFVLNAVLEERFYRGWLQTRLEHVFGRWTAIGTASLLWAAWHLALHTTDRPLVDAAAVVAHLGVLGLLLGYLWSRYRNPWALLAVHGATNAPLDLVQTAWP